LARGTRGRKPRTKQERFLILRAKIILPRLLIVSKEKEAARIYRAKAEASKILTLLKRKSFKAKSIETYSMILERVLIKLEINAQIAASRLLILYNFLIIDSLERRLPQAHLSHFLNIPIKLAHLPQNVKHMYLLLWG